jgi:hypothetical protein
MQFIVNYRKAAAFGQDQALRTHAMYELRRFTKEEGLCSNQKGIHPAMRDYEISFLICSYSSRVISPLALRFFSTSSGVPGKVYSALFFYLGI